MPLVVIWITVKLNNPLMGTETQAPYSHSVRVLPYVKLNNPLMGTETRYIWIYQRLPPQYHVKLNNPLMGTETLNSPGEKNIPLKSNYVKLNNPLMGTETDFLKLLQYKSYIHPLN